MDHGGSRAARYQEMRFDDDIRGRLEWRTIGAWRYALGHFGTIQGCRGLAPWTVRIGERFAGFFRTLDGARCALEEAAQAARYDVAT
jgi:hypothetical protein